MKKQSSKKSLSPKTQISNFKFREARESDILQLVSLENLSFNYDQLAKKQFTKFIRDEKNLIQVLEIDRKIAGYALVFFRKNSKKTRMYSLCVHPDFKGMGLGKKLMLEVFKQLRRKKIESVKLEVKVSNQVGVNLYESLGFELVERIKEFYSDGEDAFVYRLTL